MAEIESLSPQQSEEINAYYEYEGALFRHLRATGDVYHDGFDANRVIQTAHQLEEIALEAIEAGSLSELQGLQDLRDELSQSAAAMRYHDLTDLADELGGRVQAIETLIAILEREHASSL